MLAGRDDIDPRQRVVVTGMGLVTPLGRDLDDVFAAMRAGRSGVDVVRRFDATGLPCDIAGQIDDDDLAPPHPDDERGGSELRLARTATDDARRTAKLDEIEDRTRVAVVLGGHGSTPGIAEIDRYVRHTDDDGVLDAAGLAGEAQYDSRQFTVRQPDAAPALLANYVDARGAALPIVSACAAGAQAIGEATRLLREGRADAVVTGGAEPLLSYSGYLGFAILGALTRRYPSPQAASRPFDRKRNGFVIAEGAGILILETLANARARGVDALGEILGYGDSADAYRITDVHPRGDGAVLAMRRAIRDAGLTPDDVDYVNAHGTSTPTNDPVETLAIKRVIGGRAARVPVSSNKSMLGHTIGAAGAIEAILSLRGMRDGVVLPTINYEFPDRRCDLDYVPNEAREMEHSVVLSSSFGFGGQNGCLCLGPAA